ncbi:MAG: MFS transporter [Syntrophales bacterium]|jgi:MFS transporter, AAHS family, cis,cis-muconate transporter
MSQQVEKMDKIGKTVAFAVFIALVVDGMNLQTLPLALPSLMKEMSFSSTMAGALATYTLIGMGLGGVFAGWLADRIGRVKVSFWSIAIFSAGTTLLAFSQNYWQVALLRFLSGLGIGSLYSVGNLLASEYVPTRIRTTVLGILQAGWSVGYVIISLISAYILPNLGWRPLFVVAALTGVYSLWLLHNISDPPSWFAARQAAKAAGKVKNEFALIWANKNIRRTFIFWSLTAIALQFAYYGAQTWLPTYLVKDLGVNLKNMGWYIAATYTMMVIGKVVTGYLADKFGRKFMWVTCGIITAVYLPFVIYAATPGNVAFLLIIFGFLYGAPYAINATYMSESFPTSVRGTGLSTAYNLGRIGSAISPLMIGYLATTYTVGAGIALLGISYAFMAFIPGFFIPEKMYDPKSLQAADIRAETEK